MYTCLSCQQCQSIHKTLNCCHGLQLSLVLNYLKRCIIPLQNDGPFNHLHQPASYSMNSPFHYSCFFWLYSLARKQTVFTGLSNRGHHICSLAQRPGKFRLVGQPVMSPCNLRFFVDIFCDCKDCYYMNKL